MLARHDHIGYVKAAYGEVKQGKRDSITQAQILK